jgi:GrpB-like predicted nucleotidyltransferase (UPF0157 family)
MSTVRVEAASMSDNDDEFWRRLLRNHLTLRDRLRRHAGDLTAYATLKRTLAAQCADADEYTRRKTDFILSILAKYSFSEPELEIRRSNG